MAKKMLRGQIDPPWYRRGLCSFTRSNILTVGLGTDLLQIRKSDPLVAHQFAKSPSQLKMKYDLFISSLKI